MGYLTTFTIYNDGVDLVSSHAQEFADKILDAARSYEPSDIPLGNFCNLIKAQKPRHADDHTVYVHAGNTVCEMNINSDETNRLMKQHPKYFEKLLKEMWYQYRALRREFKNVVNQNARQEMA